ncbi:MAG: aspartyl protease family protein [Woeseiaceae bacterium]|nr:aspartyl protease family protein [Woeseiaceae bacterium]
MCLSVILALLLAGCAAELVLEKDGALAVIPREDRTSKHLLVDAMVNDEGPFRLALDTAASISVLIDSTAETADVQLIPGKRVLLRGMTGSGTYPAATARNISLGELAWEPPLLAILPDDLPVARHMDGLLGTDFLGQYAVAYFADERAVRLYPKGIVEGSGFRGWTSIPLYEMHVGQSGATVLVFNVIIAGERVPAIFDIGADASLMNHRAARSVGAHVRRGTSGVTGATGPTIVATELIFWEIRVGAKVWHRRNFLVADFPVFEALGLRRRPAAIAGLDLFRGHDFIVDFAGERLLVREARHRAK